MGAPLKPRKKRTKLMRNSRPGSRNKFAKMWAENREYMLSVQKRASAKAGRPLGHYDGYSKEEIQVIRERAAAEAERIIEIMEQEGIIEPLVAPVTDEDVSDDKRLAREALKVAVQIMREPINSKDKLSAARTVLEYTKSKPAATVNANVSTAEDFLGALLAKDNAQSK